MHQQQADSVFVSELFQLADDFIIAGVAVSVTAQLTHLLQRVHDYQSCVRMLFEKQLQLIFQTAADLFGAGGKVEFFCAVHSKHTEHPILQPFVIIFQRKIEDGTFPDGVIPQRLTGADVVSKLGKRTIKQQNRVNTVDTASEALAVSIGEKACVDLNFMASLMGGSDKIPQIVEDLKGVIYKDPASGPFDLADGGSHWENGWQTADEYLSGNVRQKLRTAQRAAERDSFFAGNVDALIAAQPKDLEASEIEVRLGATWLGFAKAQAFPVEVGV